MDLKAKLSFSGDDIEDLVKKTVAKQGYSICGDIVRGEDGSITVEVRPMSPEEKEEAGLDPRDPAEALASDVNKALDEHYERNEQMFRGLFELVDGIPSRIEAVAPAPAPDVPINYPTQGDEAPQDTQGDNEDGGEIPLVNPEDYDLDDEDDYNRYISQKRIERLRREQNQSGDIYGDGRKDEDGFVVLNNSK